MENLDKYLNNIYKKYLNHLKVAKYSCNFIFQKI